MGTIVLKIFPNGEFSRGYSASPKTPREKKPLSGISRYIDKYGAIRYRDEGRPLPRVDSDPRIFMDAEYQLFTWYSGKIVRITPAGVYLRIFRPGQPDRIAFYGHSLPSLLDSGEAVLLGSSMGLEFTEAKKPRRKRLGLTGRMKCHIRNAGFLLEDTYGNDCLSFLTLTLPSLDNDNLSMLWDNWGKIVDRFLKWLRSKYQSLGLPLEYTYCTEIQGKRNERTGQAYPHLHLLFNGRANRKSPWAITPSMARAAWVRCIRDYYTMPFTDSSLENLQRVRKSAGRYMSKYIAKGGNREVSTSDEGVPAQQPRINWGGMCRSLAQKIARATTRLEGSGTNGVLCRMFVRGIPLLLERKLIRFYSSGFIHLADNGSGGGHYGIHVGRGQLASPAFYGGLADCFSYLENCEEYLTEFGELVQD